MARLWCVGEVRLAGGGQRTQRLRNVGILHSLEDNGEPLRVPGQGKGATWHLGSIPIY